MRSNCGISGRGGKMNKVTKKEVEYALKNYHWMIKRLEIVYDIMSDDETYLVKATSRYGIEANLPKQQGTTSNPVLFEIIRRDTIYDRVRGFEKKVRMIQERIHLVTDEREKEVLHLILDGKSYSWIARHMGLSERQIRRIKDSIVTQMSDMPKTPKTSKSCV